MLQRQCDSYHRAPITGQTREAAGKVGEVFQPRAGERSEAEGGFEREMPLLLRAIPPPVPIPPREIENLAYFAAPRRHTTVRLILRDGISHREIAALIRLHFKFSRRKRKKFPLKTPSMSSHL